MTRYIVTEREVLNSVKFSLERIISNADIVKRIMREIVIDLETVLEDDCEKFEEEE